MGAERVTFMVGNRREENNTDVPAMRGLMTWDAGNKVGTSRPSF